MTETAQEKNWLEENSSSDVSPFQAVVEWILLAGLVGAFLAYGLIPAWRTMSTDFPNYYLAASIHRQGLPLDRAYDWRWFQRHKDHQQIQQTMVGFAPHPPLCALPLVPLARWPALEAKRIWLVLNLGFLALALWLLRRTTQLPWRRLLLFTFLCILPLRDSFLFGQYYIVILLLICAAYYAATRGLHFSSGALLAAAASLKIFPAFFLILFLHKRNWRAVAGMTMGGVALAALSILVFGWNVHRLLLTEILPRALHGELISPYTLQWNSLPALWHHLFLFEPEMNPNPLLNSGVVYAIVQAAVAGLLLLGFLFACAETKKEENSRDAARSTAWEWATLVALLFLLSSMPSAYHYCVLIFTAIVAAPVLLEKKHPAIALAFILLFAIACYPLPGVVWLLLQGRLVAVLLLYLLLLFNAPAPMVPLKRRPAFAIAGVFLVLLLLSNLRSLKNRAEDFPRRLPGPSAGYATLTVAQTSAGAVLNEMVFAPGLEGYRAVVLPGLQMLPVPSPTNATGDVLSIAAGGESPFIYYEFTDRQSRIFRLPADQLGRADAVPEFVAEGRDPAISQDGRWLALLRDDGAKATIWLSKDGAAPAAVAGAQNLPDVLEMSLTLDGNILAAVGSPANPYLISLNTSSGAIETLSVGPTRYPAISPEGKRLAFSRRESGSWHLFVRDLASGSERQLTTAPCNAFSPAWEDAQTLLYVTDCGRGYGLGVPARIHLTPQS